MLALILATSLLKHCPRPQDTSINDPKITDSSGLKSKSSVPAETHSKVQYEQAWKKIRESISHLYYNRVKRAKQITKFLDDAQPKVLEATNDREFRNAVEAMIHRFGDSHFAVWTKHDQVFYLFDALARGNKAIKMPTIGAYFVHESVEYNQHKLKLWCADMVINESAAANSGLREGDCILSANGKPFHPVDSLAASLGKPLTLDVLRPKNSSNLNAFQTQFSELKIKVSPALRNAINEFLIGTLSSEKVIHYKGKKFAYIHVWTLANPQFASTLQGAVLGQLYHTDGLILDIRGGFGGRPEGILPTFFAPPINLKWQMPNFHHVEHTGYSKPMVLLIDHVARSAKEVVSQMFKDSNRAVLVGQTTAGNVLGTTPMPLASWLYLEMPIMNVFVNGVRLEGKGVSPNIPAPLGFDAKGKDLTLVKGEKVLYDLIKKERQKTPK